MEVVSFMKTILPFVAIVMVEFTDVGVSTLSKAAMEKGMSSFVFTVYSNALATLLLLPYFIFLRKKGSPLTFSLICGFFLLGLNGSLGQILAYTGIKYSSPALLSAMANLIPVFTFLLAIIFRMEKVDLRRGSSQAKCVGAIVTVFGAFIVTLYKGSILLSSSPSNSTKNILLKQSNWIFGGLLFAITCLFSALWNIAQTSFVHKYPEEMSIVFFFTFFVALQSAIFSLIVERNPDVWKLRYDIQMMAIAFSAVFGSVFRIAVHTWCLGKKGPVFVAMFKPLGIAIAVFMGVTVLGDPIYVGSVIGSSVIAVGFYTVMWGKMKEREGEGLSNGVVDLESSTQKRPLLQSSYLSQDE